MGEREREEVFEKVKLVTLEKNFDYDYLFFWPFDLNFKGYPRLFHERKRCQYSRNYKKKCFLLVEKG